MTDEWTCPCGHEIDVTTGGCIVWDRHGRMHLVPDTSSVCCCHDVLVDVLEAWKRESP